VALPPCVLRAVAGWIPINTQPSEAAVAIGTFLLYNEFAVVQTQPNREGGSRLAMETNPVILVVQGVGRNGLTKMLEKHGYTVLRAVNGKQAVAQVKEALPSLAVIDPSSLRINPARLSHMLKRASEAVLIMWVLDKGTSVSQDGLADAWVERPLSSRKFVGRVKKLLPEPQLKTLEIGDLVFDTEQRQVIRGGRQVRVTPKQAKLLEALMRHPNEVLSRRYLMKHVWNTDYLGDTRTLDVHIRWVREAIEEDPSNPTYVLTVRGVGYRFETPKSDPSTD
jgi:DNA-binding response OmpR family regulator